MRELLAAVPATAYAAIIAALLSAGIALLGVYLSNRSQMNRLLLQLQHERKIQHEDLIREKIEELYLISRKHSKRVWLHYFPYLQSMQGKITYNQALDLGIDRSPQDYEPERLNVLIDLYFPALRPTYEKILAESDCARSIVAEHKEDYKAGNARGRELFEDLRTCLANIEEAGTSMRREITSLAEAHSKPKELAGSKLLRGRR